LNQALITQVSGRIESFFGESAEGTGFFLVDVVVRGQPSNLVVEVYVDGDEGINAGTCAGISRALGKELDESVLSHASYTLTVSSPGLDRPLKYPRQYPKHAGRGISLKLRSGDSIERLRGILASAGDRTIIVEPGAGAPAREIAYDDVLEAKIEPRW
jgi:ribosome maturation factor RimP